MTYTLEDADKIGKPQGQIDLPFEVKVYSAGGKGHFKNDKIIWRGGSLVEGLKFYRLAFTIVQMFVDQEWAMVILRGNGQWYSRAIFLDGKVDEETS